MGAALTATGYHTELIDGREVEKPLPKNLHAFVQSYVLQQIGRKLSDQYLVFSELNIRCGPDRLVPDVVVALRSAHYIDGDLADPPLLAVEILSPGQTIGNLFDKADRLVRTGTPICWVIWPERRQAWHYTVKELTEAKQQLQVTLPDNDCISIALPELWKNLDQFS